MLGLDGRPGEMWLRSKYMSVCSGCHCTQCKMVLQCGLWGDGLITAHTYQTVHSTRHLESNLSFSIHILFDNWVRNSRLFGSLRTSDGTNPLFSSTFSSSSRTITEFVLCDLLDFSWLIVIAEKCCLKPLKAADCLPNFCLKTLKDSVWFPDLPVTAILSLLILLLLLLRSRPTSSFVQGNTR